MPASGHQDHTPSPSASGTLVSRTFSVHRIPLRVRDVAQRPSVWDGMAEDIQLIWVFGKSEYFSWRGWTRRRVANEVICPSGWRRWEIDGVAKRRSAGRDTFNVPASKQITAAAMP